MTATVVRDPQAAYDWLVDHRVDVATATVVRKRLEDGRSVTIVNMYDLTPLAGCPAVTIESREGAAT